MKIALFASTTATLLARKAATSAFTAPQSLQTIFRQIRGNEVVLASSNVSRFLASSSSSADQEIHEGQMLDVSRFMSGNRPEGTEDYIMQQTMVRVKDPEKSLAFYCDVLGFKLIHYSEFPQWKFNVYFVAPVDPSTVKATRSERWNHCMTTPGCIELTWNYGSEKEEGKVYNTGNADATGTSDGEKVRGGFGHIGITVPNVYTACERFHSLGVEFHKSPNSGGMKGLAFIKDPDGYLIEVLPQGEMVAEPVDCLGVAADGGEGYKDNSK
eukprot:CAMPEP_0171369758 /NCGR_PEP_ID=MMETSP0879-20121228/7560_1 /TAXON_ID=67004 /ORGANISM="Thalassiosira weissflogii, Strain CCMP1336" /LENGTH=269 /DNA_ID=CAMNT_0011878111 /DNA_START=56 /DNA_END=865 /DNA_ORIENTATION=-